MERLEEMLLGIGKLLQQHQEQMQERISLLEKRIEELEAKLVPDSCQVDIPNSMETVIPEEKEEDAVVEVVEEDVEDVVVEDIEDVVDEDVAVDDFVESVEEDAPVGDMEIEEEIVGEEEEDAGAAPEIEIEFEFDDEDEYVDEEVAGGTREEILLMDKAKPEWYDWEVDIPGPHIDDIWDGIGLNDRLLFLRELFYGNEEDFRDVVARLNTMERLVQATELIRERYPQWNEESDEVYRFYMTVRRRFNK